MNLQQFAALKPGDKVENPMAGSVGEVVSVDEGGVFIHWTGAGQMLDSKAQGTARHYSVQSTIWMHWTLPEPETAEDCPVAAAERLNGDGA